jgi:hypothetical protein
MFLMRADPLRGQVGRGLGPGNREFFGPCEMATLSMSYTEFAPVVFACYGSGDNQLAIIEADPPPPRQYLYLKGTVS